MSNRKKIIIVGAGPGGLSAAMILAGAASLTTVHIAGGLLIADQQFSTLYRIATICVILGTSVFLFYARGRFKPISKAE